MSMLDSPFRSGTDPSGTGGRFTVSVDVRAAEDLADEDLADEAVGEAAAEVTVTVSSAAGGVHFAVVTTLAVAVSVTELTELAFDATAICASRVAGVLAVTELRVHEAVPSPLAQPLVNSGFWLDGCAVSVTDTVEADPPTVETWTT
jgi:hypothetical protein